MNAHTSLDLSGEWTLRLDRTDTGITDRLFNDVAGDAIQLPGSLQERGFGDDPQRSSPWIGDFHKHFDRWDEQHPDVPLTKGDRFRSPYCLTPRKIYVGVAWFARQITIPDDWAGQRVTLFVERAHWRTQVWVDGQPVGSDDSLGTPHEFELFKSAVPGSHRLVVRVDNRIEGDGLFSIGFLSHSISDHTQGNWNGLAGAIELRCTPAVFIDQVQVFPDVAARSVRAEVAVHNCTMQPVEVRVSSPNSAAAPVVARAMPGATKVALHVPYSARTPLWDEFNPAMQQLEVMLESPLGKHAVSESFAFREVGTSGTQLTLNGRPISLRGTLECCIFPLTGYPPSDKASWARVIKTCQAHGLNHIRFHSHCPPKAAFQAADELGFYFQVECSSWANADVSIGSGQPVDEWIYRECERILRAYGNHPSFMLLAYGNEPGGPQFKPYLARFMHHFRSLDRRRLYTSGAGWPVLPESDYDSVHAPRLHQWGDGLASRLNARAPETCSDYRDYLNRFPDRPSISHEIGQWCVYPNFAEQVKYVGVMQPRNLEIIEELARHKHLRHRAEAFLHASGKLQALCYKEEIEAALRTPGFGGFQLLDLHDFPGQGTALVGVLDPFWESKGYITASEFRRFCGPTVLLARLPRLVLNNQQSLEANIELYHFGKSDLDNCTITWQLTTASGAPLASGRFGPSQFARSALHSVGQLLVPLSSVKGAEQLRLTTAIEGSDVANHWDVFVYPATTPAAPIRCVTTSIPSEAIELARKGASVLLLPEPGLIRNAPTPVQIGFSSIFWNTVWTKYQAPHSLGIFCDPAHPMFSHFPTDAHSNWQWWDLISRAKPMFLDGAAPQMEPIVHVIDDWFRAYRLGLVVEANVGAGRVVACSMDLETDLDSRPAAMQFRASLMHYVASDARSTAPTLDETAMRTLFVF